MSIEAIAGFSGGIAAFLAMLFGGFLWLLSQFRKDYGNLRQEVTGEIKELRTEVREEIKSLREENAQFRQEMREENAQFRQEMREESAQLRQEMREDNARLRQELLMEIREGNQRILDALYYHRHDPATGAATFHPPQAAD